MLKFRSKYEFHDSEQDKHSKTPYGIPIYDLLEQVNKTAQSQSNSECKPPPSKKRKKVPQTLFCEKYRANDFFSLLGNDDPNRFVLKWLNSWSCSATSSPTTSSESRPEKLILLLHGPPGCGKTTAAHAIAKQKGYKVMEINASDDRTKQVVKARIAPLVSMHQATSKEPVCVILDEIDGAAEHGLVRALIELIRTDQKSHQKSTASTAKSKSQANGTPHSRILRPIIAVCNDAYSPAMRALRPYCELIRFQKPHPSKLIQRLETICSSEGIKTNSKNLNSLIAQCDFDLRSCLNALQYYQTSDLNTIFTSQFGKDSHTLTEMIYDNKRPLTFSQIETCTDPERLIDTCFSVCLHTGFIDNRLTQPSNFADFSFLASLSHSNIELNSVIAQAFGAYFRSPKPLHYTYTLRAEQTQFRAKLREISKLVQNIINKFRNQSDLEVRALFTNQTVLYDLLPLATQLSAPLGLGVGTKSKTKTQQIHEICRTIGMEFILENSDGVQKWSVDPPLDELFQCFNNTSVVDSQINAARGKVASYIHATKPVMNILETQKEAPKRTWVQYFEGFSSAVRKPITWNEFFRA